MPQKPVRTSRIEARIALDALKVVKRAAEIQGRSVSDFVIAAAQEVATRTIEDAQIIRLSVEDQRAFAEAVLNPVGNTYVTNIYARNPLLRNRGWPPTVR